MWRIGYLFYCDRYNTGESITTEVKIGKFGQITNAIGNVSRKFVKWLIESCVLILNCAILEVIRNLDFEPYNTGEIYLVDWCW
jgi:hypothetical protein